MGGATWGGIGNAEGYSGKGFSVWGGGVIVVRTRGGVWGGGGCTDLIDRSTSSAEEARKEGLMAF